MRQLLLRGLPPPARDDDGAAAVASASTSCVLLDENEWRSLSPRGAVAAALVKRHRRRPSSTVASSGLSRASALALADKCWLELDGRALPRGEPLGASCSPGFESGSSDSPHLIVECRLCTVGGGGDGGSTGAESRSSYLEMYASAKPDAVDPRLLEATRATTCALSGEPLRPPIVADALGSLYNKDAVLSALLDKTSKALPSAMAHVSSLRHVFDARVTEVGDERGAGGGSGAGGANGAATEKAGDGNGAAASSSSLSPRFCCPVTGIHLNGRNKFLLLRPSGLVVSERAVRVAMPAVEEAAAELLSSSGAKTEGEKVDVSTAIRLLPPLSELASAREKLLLERAAEAAAKAQKKKHKKDKKRKDGERDNDDEEEAAKQRRLEEEAERKRRLVAASTAALAPKGADKEVFASLFLSSRKDAGGSKETFACRSTALGRR